MGIVRFCRICGQKCFADIFSDKNGINIPCLTLAYIRFLKLSLKFHALRDLFLLVRLINFSMSLVIPFIRSFASISFVDHLTAEGSALTFLSLIKFDSQIARFIFL